MLTPSAILVIAKNFCAAFEARMYKLPHKKTVTRKQAHKHRHTKQTHSRKGSVVSHNPKQKIKVEPLTKKNI